MKLGDRLSGDGRPARANSGLAGAVEGRPAPVQATARPARTVSTPVARPAGTPAPGSSGPEPVDDLRASVRDAVVQELGPRLASTAVDDRRIRALIEKHLDRALQLSRASIAPAEREAFVDRTLADMVGWGPLTSLMADPTVTEVMCNGPHAVYVERDGLIELTSVRFSSDAALRQVIDRMLAAAGRRADEAMPMADGRLADGSRINVVLPPLSLVGPVLTVRRFPETAMTIADLIARETLSTDAAVFLEAAVRGKLNVLVSGGTSTGKTTLLNVLSTFIPDGERIVTIEDAAELRLAQPHVVSLETRQSNIEGSGQVTIRDLVRNALRMRPDRIVVGEVRGGESLDMLQAMNTGHEGSLTTVHANSARDALLRLETMVLMAGFDLPLRAVREQVASAIDVVVQVERARDGSRIITSIAEVQGREGDVITLQEIFTRPPDGALRATGLRPRCADRLADAGVDLPLHVLRAVPTTPTVLRHGRPM